MRIDVRVVFGTSVDLDELVARGLFRAELQQDAAPHRLEIPSLRSRPEDIAALSENALRKVAAREGLAPRSLTLDALHLLQSYQWPGNLRELESVIERACMMDSSRRLTAALLEPWMTVTATDDVPCGLTLQEMERRLIETTFARFAGNRKRRRRRCRLGFEPCRASCGITVIPAWRPGVERQAVGADSRAVQRRGGTARQRNSHHNSPAGSDQLVRPAWTREKAMLLRAAGFDQHHTAETDRAVYRAAAGSVGREHCQHRHSRISRPGLADIGIPNGSATRGGAITHSFSRSRVTGTTATAQSWSRRREAFSN